MAQTRINSVTIIHSVLLGAGTGLGGDNPCSVPGSRVLGLREGCELRMQGTSFHSLGGQQRLPVEERLVKYFNCLGVGDDPRGRREQGVLSWG